MLIYHFDAKTTFLNGVLEEEIYMRQSLGFAKEEAEDMVCLLRKSIYGLKQSARVWNETIHNVLIKAKFTQSKSDNCLYIYNGNEEKVYVLICI